MSDFTDINELGWQFVQTLYEHTTGDIGAQASMYDIGNKLGMDKPASSSAAEKLIGWGLIEIKTLSGAIGMTDEGKAQVEQRFGLGVSDEQDSRQLTNAVVIEEELQAVLSQLITTIKSGISGYQLDFEPLTELMSDIKSLEAQLGSPRPKTAIAREILGSIKYVLEKAGAKTVLSDINNLLGE